MNVFADRESPLQTASRIANDLRSYLQARPAIAVTVTVQDNQVFIQPSSGAPFEITCDASDAFRVKSIGSARGVQQQVYQSQPAWSDNQTFDAEGMSARVKAWLETQRTS